MGENMVQAGSRCRDDRWSLLGMTALVTGGTQGIGSLSLQLIASWMFLFEGPCLYGAGGYRVIKTSNGLLQCFVIVSHMLLWRNWQG